MKKKFPHKYFIFDILDSTNKIKYEDIEGQFNSTYIKFETTDSLTFTPGDIIIKKYDDGQTQNFQVTSYEFKRKFHCFPAHYEVNIIPVGTIPLVSKIEIVNTHKLASDLSEAFGINIDIVNKILLHQSEIKQLFEEHNFLTADSLTVAKETLSSMRSNENKLEIDKILNVINTLVSIFTAIK